MSWAKAHAAELDRAALTRVTTDLQTGGRGQFGKSWHSPPGNLYASFCFFVPIGFPDLPHAAQLLALSAAKALETHALAPKLKRPNDILVEGKKIGGVLCEVHSQSDQMLVVDGIGLNIILSKEECDAIDQPATSLSLELDRPISAENVLEALTQQFQSDLGRFLKEGFASFQEEFKKKLVDS